MKGYTDSELEELKRQDDLLTGSSKLSMPAISAGSFAAFNVGNDMSVQTINPGGKRPGTTSVAGDDTYKMGTDSQASLFTNNSYGFGDFQEEDMEEDNGKEVEILMPEGGLNDMDTDDGAEEENISTASAMSPMDLVNKFGDDDENLVAWETKQRN